MRQTTIILLDILCLIMPLMAMVAWGYRDYVVFYAVWVAVYLMMTIPVRNWDDV